MEIGGLHGEAIMAAMQTPDYWLYSIGLVFVTVLVLVA